MRNRTGYWIIAAVVLLISAAFAIGRPLVKSAFSSQEPELIVVVDAGHGGIDGGAVSASGIVESRLNLEITKRVALLLEFCGQRTLLTRHDEGDLASQDAATIKDKKVSDLKNRVTVINAVPNAVLLSIHQNSLAGNISVRGAQAFYNTVYGANDLAVSIQHNLNQICNTDNHKLAKQIDGSIYLMSEVQCQAVLVECGFLSNPAEAQLLCAPIYQKQVTIAVAAGYLQYTNEGDV